MVDGKGNFRHFTLMLVRLVLSLHRAVLLVALTVALLATGFAHRLPTAQDDALEFALANGASLSDICGDDLRGGPHAGTDCQACQISSAADLPPRNEMRIDLALAFDAKVIAPLEVRAIVHAPDPAHRPQGPPVA